MRPSRHWRAHDQQSPHSLSNVVGAPAARRNRWKTADRSPRRQCRALAVRPGNAAKVPDRTARAGTDSRYSEFQLGGIRHAHRNAASARLLRTARASRKRQPECGRDRSLSRLRRGHARCGLGIHRPRRSPEIDPGRSGRKRRHRPRPADDREFYRITAARVVGAGPEGNIRYP